MNYHLLSGINKYLHQTSINVICSLGTYNNGFKNTYLYKIPIIKINHNTINEKTSKRYKYIVGGINSREELKKIMNYDIHIIGIVLVNYNESINNLPQSLKSLIIWGIIFNQSLDNLPQYLKSLKIYGYTFNQSLDNLPQSLKSLIIEGYTFNQSLDKLPQYLKSLKIWGIVSINHLIIYHNI